MSNVLVAADGNNVVIHFRTILICARHDANGFVIVL